MYSLQKVTDNDLMWLLELHNDPEVLQNLTDPRPITFEQHLQWWNNTKNNKKEERLIFYVNDDRVGFTKFYGIDKNNFNCCLGADIHKDHRGKGYAKHMWHAMLEHCFYDLTMHRVWLTTADYNEIAQKVYKRVGFLEEGKRYQSLLRFGKWCDEIQMYVTKDMDWGLK